MNTRANVGVVGLVVGLVLLGAVVVGAHAAQKIVAGQLAGGGGSSAGGGLKLVGAVSPSPAGVSSGGGLKLTGGFIAGAQVWGGDDSSADRPAATTGNMVSALAATSAGSGAQITFTLSAPATVEVRVLNIAGRPIRTITPGRECEAGLNTLVWTGLSDTGLQAPNGAYLVTVTARTRNGAQSRALAQIRKSR